MKKYLEKLKQLKKDGYHQRISGAIFISDVDVECDCCQRPTKSKVGYENNYPKNKDIGLCSQCDYEFSNLQ